MNSWIRLSACAAVLAMGSTLVVGSSSASASTLCFDAESDVVGIDGASCCVGGSPSTELAAECLGNALSCEVRDGCSLTLRAASNVRVVDRVLNAPTRANLWAPDTCCVAGTLQARPRSEVTAQSPEPLTCELRPGCQLAVTNHGKVIDPTSVEAESLEVGLPWSAEAWAMFVGCARDMRHPTAVCFDNWLTGQCPDSLCVDRRDEVVVWLDKVIAPSLVDAPAASVASAILYTTAGEGCCIEGTAAAGPFFGVYGVHATRCSYRQGCAPSNGDLLVFGDEGAITIKDRLVATDLGQDPTVWAAVCGGSDNGDAGAVAALEQRLIEANNSAMAAQLAHELALTACEDAFQDYKNGVVCNPTGGGPGTTVLATPDTLTVMGDFGAMNVLDNDGFPGAELVALSPPTNGIAVWQPDGELSYFPNPGFSGTETLFYQAVAADGTTITGTVAVAVP